MTLDPSEFIAGDNVTDDFEPPRGRGGVVVSVRLAANDADRLSEAAEATGRTISQVAREALLSYLDDRAISRLIGAIPTISGTVDVHVMSRISGAYSAGPVVVMKQTSAMLAL